jgi:putative hydrolase of the HAD superfamily
MNPGVIASVRAVTLDVGGTLLEPHPGVGITYANVLRRRGWEADEALLEKRFCTAFKQQRSGRSPQVNEASERASWRAIVEHSISPWCPDKQLDEVFAELWETFAKPECWRPIRRVKRDLEFLHHAGGIPLYVFSNWDSRLHQVLRAFNWEKYFRGVFISTELGFEKPSPKAFAKVQKILGLPPQAILHVGDSLEHDYEGARAAGWHAALAYPKPKEALRRRTLQDLDELLWHAPFGPRKTHGISPPNQ